MRGTGTPKALTYEERFQNAIRLTKEQDEDSAIRILSSLLDENPQDSRIYGVLGEAALNRRAFPEALKSLRLSKQLDPENKFISIRIADAYMGMGKYSKAKKLLDSIKHQFIGSIDAPLWALGMAEVSRCLGDFKTAENYLDYCIQEAPNWSVPYGSLSALYLRQHRYAEAIPYMQRQYELKPTWKFAHELGMVLPYIEDWEGAYKYWKLAGDMRWGNGQFLGTPLWDGQPCEILRVYGDGGLGDTIQYSRYLMEALKICKRVIFSPQQRHLEVVKALELPGIEIADENSPKGDYASWLMVMMGGLKLYRPDQSPPPTRFKSLPPRKGIAITWAGDPKHANDRTRSMKLKDFSKLILQLPEYEWFTVSPGDKIREEIRQSHLPITQYEGTLLESCERLLSAETYVGVDTGHAHVTATQGIPTHVIFKEFVDCRWGVESERSGYYDSLRLYRSYKDGWPECLNRIAGRLHETDGSKT